MADDDQGECGYCGEDLAFCGHDPGYIKGGPVPDRYPNEFNAHLIIEDEGRFYD